MESNLQSPEAIFIKETNQIFHLNLKHQFLYKILANFLFRFINVDGTKHKVCIDQLHFHIFDDYPIEFYENIFFFHFSRDFILFDWLCQTVKLRVRERRETRNNSRANGEEAKVFWRNFFQISNLFDKIIYRSVHRASS